MWYFKIIRKCDYIGLKNKMPKFIPERKTRPELYAFIKRNKIGNVNSKTKKNDLVRVIRKWQYQKKVGSKAKPFEQPRSYIQYGISTYEQILDEIKTDFTELTLKEQEEMARQFYLEDQERARMEKDILLRGKLFSIDRSIYDIIKNLNEFGYITMFSCSGLKLEHKYATPIVRAYIVFDRRNIKDKSLVINTIRQSGWNIENLHTVIDKKGIKREIFIGFPNQLAIALPDTTPDNIIRQRFKRLENNLLSLNPNQIFKRSLKKQNKIGGIFKRKVCYVDEGVVIFIQKLNDMGFVTKYSCSGLKQDHQKRKPRDLEGKIIDFPLPAYVEFDYKKTKKRKHLISIAKKQGWTILQNIRANSFTISLEDTKALGYDFYDYDYDKDVDILHVYQYNTPLSDVQKQRKFNLLIDELQKK